MKMLKKKDKAKPQNDTVGDNSITINADVKDFRFVSPLDPDAIDFAAVENSNREFVKEAQIDDASPSYREPLIDATLEKYDKYIDRHKVESIHLWSKIISGAKAQQKCCYSEEDFINTIPIDELIG